MEAAHLMRRTGVAWLIMAFCLVWLLQPGPVRATAPSSPFGVIESYESPADADDLGVGWTRVRLQWAEVQAGGPTSWTPTVSDAQIDAELQAGRQVIGLLIGIPAWARDGRGLPRGLWLGPDDPANTWAVFVRAAVTRYAGRIDHWIIWNEPDIWDVATPGHTWDGNEADFAQLLRVAYVSARAVNPAAIIHLAALTYFWDANFGRTQYLERLLTELTRDPQAPANNYYFDIATAHLYFQPGQIYDILTTWQTILADHGLSQPWWLVETNAPVTDDPTWPVASITLSVHQVEQAAFIPQALASALAAGAERIAVFKLKDTDSDRQANPEPFGLVRLDGSRRPAFTTYQIAGQRLAGVWGGARERWDAVGQIRLDQTQQSTTVVFARLPLPQTASVPATASQALLVSQTGQMTTITPEAGFFQVSLPPALCSQSIGDYCMIGGETFYVVQTAARRQPAATPSPPINSATAIPTATAASTPGVVVQATTSPTVGAGFKPTLITTSATPRPTAIPASAPDIVAQATSSPTVGMGLKPAPTTNPDPQAATTPGATGITWPVAALAAGVGLTLGFWLALRRHR